MSFSRIKVVFIKAHKLNGLQWYVGNKTNMRMELATELKEKKIIQEYSGEWPPKKKTKIKLKDLK